MTRTNFTIILLLSVLCMDRPCLSFDSKSEAGSGCKLDESAISRLDSIVNRVCEKLVATADSQQTVASEPSTRYGIQNSDACLRLDLNSVSTQYKLQLKCPFHPLKKMDHHIVN